MTGRATPLNSGEERRTIAACVAFAYMALALFVQVENFAAALLPSSGRIAATVTFLAKLVLLQGEHVVVALLLGGCVALVWPWRPLRYGALVLVTLANGYMAIDHVVYPAFHDHLHPSRELFDGFRAATDSFTAEMRWSWLATLLAFCAVSVLVWSPRVRTAATRRFDHRQPGRRSIAILACYSLISVVASTGVSNENLETPPMLTLLRTVTLAPLNARRGMPSRDLTQLHFGNAEDAPAEREQLAEIFAATRQTSPRPNIILIILESIGTEQLFDHGHVRADLAPALARIGERGVTFDSVYTVAPQTIFSLQYLHTGGHTITWGWDDAYDQLLQPYQGPTMAGAIHDAGYTTAFFSSGSLYFRRSDVFLPMAGYDLVLHGGSLSPEERSTNALSTWGVKDDYMFERAAQWVEAAAQQDKPWMMEIQDLATHHPYGIPGQTVKSAADRTQYDKAARYIDGVIGTFLDRLDRQGLLANTIVAVTGDHGEAFRVQHKDHVYLFRSLYDECLKTFLIVDAPPHKRSPLLSHRVGSMADIGGTLAALAGAQPPGAAQNLMGAEFSNRLLFFQWRFLPIRYGLLDGQWKFLTNARGDRSPELFDLRADPGEQHNLAGQFPAMVETYTDLCDQWYGSGTTAYAENLGHPIDTTTYGTIAGEEQSVPGPKTLQIGRSAVPFQASEVVAPSDDIVAHIGFVAYDQPHNLRLDWRSPSLVISSVDLTVPPGNPDIAVPCKVHPLEAGKWWVTLWDGPHPMLRVPFVVAAP